MKFIVREKDYEYEYLLYPGVIIVGRDETCDLTISSHAISRRHLSCTVRNDRVSIKDLGSRNGAKVNGKRVKEAELSDGDEVRIGDVHLTLKMSAQPGAAPLPPPLSAASGETGREDRAREPQIEDEEITPSDGSLVRVDPAESQAGLYERDGHWYVSDPATGREVEIVPAGAGEKKKAAREGRKSLLATRKGRMVLGGIAAAVILFFMLSLLMTEGEQPQNNTRTTVDEFDRTVAEALEALEAGELDLAAEKARSIAGVRHDRGAADSLLQLVELWGHLDEDFWEYWRDVVRQLHALKRNHEPASRFVERHVARIDEAVLEYEHADRARQALERDEAEEAYLILSDIDPERPVMRDNASLFSEVRSQLRRELEDRLQSARDRNRWDEAREAADKLMLYFPETREKLEEERESYTTLAAHANILSEARQHFDAGRFGRAVELAETIPETSSYREGADALIRTAEESRTVATAEQHFNGGDVQEALNLIEGLTTADARALRRRINNATRLFNAAREAEEARDYSEAEQQWRRLERLERRHGGTSEFFNAAQNALRDMTGQRRRYATELVAMGEARQLEGQYREARETFEKAMRTDPEGEIGREGLNRLRERAIIEYMNAINEDDPRSALDRLKTVMEMLSPDDLYYRRARERSDEIERELGQ